MMAGERRTARRALITAARGSAGRLASALESRGIEAVHLPCIQIAPPVDESPLAGALATLDTFDILVVTSANGAEALARHELPRAGLPEVVVVGPTTAARVRAQGLEISMISSSGRADAIAEGLARRGIEGRSVLVLLGDLADDRLERELELAGATVTRVDAYRTVEGVEDPTAARGLFEPKPRIEVVTLMSGSAARGLHGAIGATLFGACPLACIGPSTARVVEQLGGRPAVIASPHTARGLAEAVASLVR